MRYSFAAVLALASAVVAQTTGFDVISKPGNLETVPAASTYTIVWAPKAEHTGTVTISLIGGKDQKSLQAIGTLGTADNTDGKFEWDVSKDLGDQAVYGIQITWDQDKSVFQYSFPFHIGGSGAGGSAFPSITPSANSTISKTSASVSVSTPAGNYSSTTPTKHFTTALSTGASTPTKTNSAPASTSTGAAPSNVGSTLALFGGLAMAVFAL